MWMIWNILCIDSYDLLDLGGSPPPQILLNYMFISVVDKALDLLTAILLYLGCFLLK